MCWRPPATLRHAAGAVAAFSTHCNARPSMRKSVLAAAGIRMFIKSPFHLISLREAVIFVLIAVVIAPVVTAFWGPPSPSPITLNSLLGRMAQPQHLERSTAIVLVPVILVAPHQLFARSSRPHPGASGSVHCRGIATDTRLRSAARGTGTARAPYAPVSAHLGALRFGLEASAAPCWSSRSWRSGDDAGTGRSDPNPSGNALNCSCPPDGGHATMLFMAAIDDERRSKEALQVSRSA